MFRYISYLVIIIIGVAFRFFLTSSSTHNCLDVINSNYFDHKTNVYISNKVIRISKNIITDIVDLNSNQHIDNNCQSVDLKGYFLYPGLIDAHTHLMAADKQTVFDWKSALEISAARPNNVRLLIGEINSKSMLLAGFTTVRDLGNSGFDLAERLKSRISDKKLIGPEIISSGPGLAVGPSQINLKYNRLEYTLIDEQTDINQTLLDYKSRHVTWIKLYADNSGRTTLIKQELLRAIVKKAQSLNFKVAVHAEYDQSITNALNVKPNSIEHFYEVPKIKIGLSKNLPFIVLTDYSFETCKRALIEKNCEDKIRSLKKRLRWLKYNNFKIVFGSDAVLDFTSNFKTRGEASLSSLISLGQIGLSPLEVLLSATVISAEMLELPIGKIEKNYTANLVAFESDPLVSLENLKNRIMVINQGEIVCKNINECQP